MEELTTDLARRPPSGPRPESTSPPFEILPPLLARWKQLALVSIAAGVVAYGVAFLLPPTFTASTTFLPPQQQGTSSALLASLGPLAGLVGGAGGLRTPADQYVALMQSVTVSDRVIDRFGLMGIYDAKFHVDARRALASNTRFSVGRKDGLITVEVDDRSPERAAEIANRYVEELRSMTGAIAIGEAQQRRVFFEGQLKQTRDKLVEAQQALQASGITPGTVNAEPRAAAQGYVQLKADIVAAEVRLQAMRSTLADNASEVVQQQNALAALRSQLARLEQSTNVQGGPDYISRYRDFKYQETLFDLYARQFELARADEGRQGALIQVVDPAIVPERRSKPKRTVIALLATVAAAALMAGFILLRHRGAVPAGRGRAEPSAK